MYCAASRRPKGTSLTASSVIRGNCFGIVRRPPEPLISDPTISAIRLRSTENILAAQRGVPTGRRPIVLQFRRIPPEPPVTRANLLVESWSRGVTWFAL